MYIGPWQEFRLAKLREEVSKEVKQRLHEAARKPGGIQSLEHVIAPLLERAQFFGGGGSAGGPPSARSVSNMSNASARSNYSRDSTQSDPGVAGWRDSRKQSTPSEYKPGEARTTVAALQEKTKKRPRRKKSAERPGIARVERMHRVYARGARAEAQRADPSQSVAWAGGEKGGVQASSTHTASVSTGSRGDSVKSRYKSDETEFSPDVESGIVPSDKGSTSKYIPRIVGTPTEDQFRLVAKYFVDAPPPAVSTPTAARTLMSNQPQKFQSSADAAFVFPKSNIENHYCADSSKSSVGARAQEGQSLSARKVPSMSPSRPKVVIEELGTASLGDCLSDLVRYTVGNNGTAEGLPLVHSPLRSPHSRPPFLLSSASSSLSTPTAAALLSRTHLEPRVVISGSGSKPLLRYDNSSLSAISAAGTHLANVLSVVDSSLNGRVSRSSKGRPSGGPHIPSSQFGCDDNDVDALIDWTTSLDIDDMTL